MHTIREEDLNQLVSSIVSFPFGVHMKTASVNLCKLTSTAICPFRNLPAEIAVGYTFPCHGRTILCSKNLAQELYGSYEHHKGQPITLGHAWAEFSAELGLAVGSLIIVKIEIRELAIKVEVKILNNN